MRVVAVLVRKELADMVREKRLAGFLLAYCVVSGAVFGPMAQSAAEQAARDAAPDLPVALTMVNALMTINMLALVILAALFVFDTVGKERDAGMLGLVLTTPASARAVFGAKALSALGVYAVLAATAGVMGAIFARVLGPVVVDATVAMIAIPLTVLFVVLLGLGLLLGVLIGSARMALAVGLGLTFLLFLAGVTDMFAGAAGNPVAAMILDNTPFAVANAGLQSIIDGSPAPTTGYAVSLVVGSGGLLLALVVFGRQEVTQA